MGLALTSPLHLRRGTSEVPQDQLVDGRRDAGQVLAVALTVWFWLTPIFLEEERLNQMLPGVVTWNPATYLVRAYRQTLLMGDWPAISDIAAMTAFALGTFVLGGLFFRQTKRGFADVL